MILTSFYLVPTVCTKIFSISRNTLSCTEWKILPRNSVCKYILMSLLRLIFVFLSTLVILIIFFRFNTGKIDRIGIYDRKWLHGRNKRYLFSVTLGPFPFKNFPFKICSKVLQWGSLIIAPGHLSSTPIHSQPKRLSKIIINVIFK